MYKKFVIPLLGLCLFFQSHAQTNISDEHKMDWFDDAKLGIFIHWGIYSVDGISESWAFFTNYISQNNYLKQLDGFSAEKYNPKEWVSLIKDSGAKYTVITTKHHDGISLWDSKQDNALTTKNDAKAQMDVLTPFVEEVKASGLKTGFYFSLPDWSHPYYDIKTRTQNRYKIKDEPARWNSFLKYYQGQLTELSELYRPDLLWFDGDWEHSSEEWKAEESLALLRKYNADIIINSRLNHHGDYATPEQGIPVKRPKDRYWELCYTMNDSWGYQHFDNNYKTPNMIVRTLVDCISMGGNLLLDIGPKADGSIPEKQVAILQELGRWTNKHAEAIYGTRAGWADENYVLEKNAFSKDGKTMYIYLDVEKENVRIEGLVGKPKKVRLVGGSNMDLPFDYKEPFLSISLAKVDFDPAVTVLAIDFDQKPTFFPLPIMNPKSIMESFVKENSSDKALEVIVNAVAGGSNFFVNKINDDGSVLDKDLVFTNTDVKDWVTKHAEVLHAAEAGIPSSHYNGKTALSPDKQTLYLFVEGEPTGPIALKGLKNKIARIRIVGEGSMLSHQVFNKLYWSAIPGIVYIDVPKSRLDKNVTVIAVLLDSPIDLFSEEVQAIENNL